MTDGLADWITEYLCKHSLKKLLERYWITDLLGKSLMLQAKKVTTATIFGVVIFLTKTVMPTPVNKMLIVVQALLLGLGNLLLNKKGATYVAVVSGVLTALSNVALAPFTFSFALLYGLLVDGLFFIFKVNTVNGKLKTGRSMAAMTLSTVLVGLLSYYTSVWFGLIPRNLPLEVIILSVGIFSGAIAGYFISIIWNNYFACMHDQVYSDR